MKKRFYSREVEVVQMDFRKTAHVFRIDTIPIIMLSIINISKHAKGQLIFHIVKSFPLGKYF